MLSLQRSRMYSGAQKIQYFCIFMAKSKILKQQVSVGEQRLSSSFAVHTVLVVPSPDGKLMSISISKWERDIQLLRNYLRHLLCDLTQS